MDGFNCIFMTGVFACGLADLFERIGPPVLAQSRFSAVNWLWVLGALVVVWILVGAMARRQTRLTGVLRAHVERQNEVQQTPEIDEKPDEKPNE